MDVDGRLILGVDRYGPQVVDHVVCVLIERETVGVGVLIALGENQQVEAVLRSAIVDHREMLGVAGFVVAGHLCPQPRFFDGSGVQIDHAGVDDAVGGCEACKQHPARVFDVRHGDQKAGRRLIDIGPEAVAFRAAPERHLDKRAERIVDELAGEHPAGLVEHADAHVRMQCASRATGADDLSEPKRLRQLDQLGRAFDGGDADLVRAFGDVVMADDSLLDDRSHDHQRAASAGRGRIGPRPNARADGRRSASDIDGAREPAAGAADQVDVNAPAARQPSAGHDAAGPAGAAKAREAFDFLIVADDHADERIILFVLVDVQAGRRLGAGKLGRERELRAILEL